MSLLLETLHQLQNRAPAARPLLPLVADDSCAASSPVFESLSDPARARVAESVEAALTEIEQATLDELAAGSETADAASASFAVDAGNQGATEKAPPRHLPASAMHRLAERLIDHVGAERFCVLLFELPRRGAQRNVDGDGAGGDLATSLAEPLAAIIGGDVLIVPAGARGALRRRQIGNASLPTLSDSDSSDFDRSRLFSAMPEAGVYRLSCDLTAGDPAGNRGKSLARALSMLKGHYPTIVVDAGPLDRTAAGLKELMAACDATLVAVPLGIGARAAGRAVARLHRLCAPRMACVAIAE